VSARNSIQPDGGRSVARTSGSAHSRELERPATCDNRAMQRDGYLAQLSSDGSLLADTVEQASLDEMVRS
jgi:hypothetical protein